MNNETVNITLDPEMEIGDIVQYNEYDVEIIGIDEENEYATCLFLD